MLKVKPEKASYTRQTQIEFVGNPLVETLPPLPAIEDYPGMLLVRAPYNEEERKLSAQERLKLLPRIGQIHIPFRTDTVIAFNLGRCISWGYAGRNPREKEEVEEALIADGFGFGQEVQRYLNAYKAPALGFPVFGVSGTGKTCSVMNAITLYPQVIIHSEYRGTPFEKTQMVWLKVDCPGDGSPKGLCSAIIKEVDEALGTDYASQYIRNRMSKDVLTTNVSRLLRSLYLGVLIIDDIQNLCTAKQEISADLLSFLVSLINNLGIPVVMIGTPKILEILTKEFQQAKRATGEGEVRMDLFEKDSPEWIRFIKALWHYQYTACTVELTDKIKDTIYRESVGNPFIASILYKLVQDDAIIGGKETFDANDFIRVSKQKLGMTAKMRKDMLNNVDVELLRYKSLWNAVDAAVSTSEKETSIKAGQKADYSQAFQAEIADQLAQQCIEAKDARRLARAAIAAFPNERNKQVLIGYALALKKEEDKTSEEESAVRQTAESSGSKKSVIQCEDHGELKEGGHIYNSDPV